MKGLKLPFDPKNQSAALGYLLAIDRGFKASKDLVDKAGDRIASLTGNHQLSENDAYALTLIEAILRSKPEVKSVLFVLLHQKGLSPDKIVRLLADYDVAKTKLTIAAG